MRSRENATSQVPNGSISNPLCYTKTMWGLKKSHKVAIFIHVYISNQRTSVYLEPVCPLVWGEGPNSIQNKGHLCPKYIYIYTYIQSEGIHFSQTHAHLP